MATDRLKVYSSLSQANPAIRGIEPPVTLAQANLIARWADRIEGDDVKSPWAAAIAQFKKTFQRKDGRWVRRKKKEATMASTSADISGPVLQAMAEDLAAHDEAEEKGLITGTVERVYVPYGIISFAELAAAKEAEQYSDSVQRLTGELFQILRNVMSNPDVDNKPAALKAAVDEYADLVDRAQDEQKAKWTAAYVNGLPDSSFLYVEPGGQKDNEGKTTPRRLRHFPYKDAEGKVDLPHLRNAISRLGQPATGKGWGKPLSGGTRRKLLGRARRMLARAQGKKALDRAFAHYVEAGREAALGVASDLAERSAWLRKAVEADRGGFMVYKDAAGALRWVAVYSSKWRDNDVPPEIITDAAHREFVEAVQKGQWPYPELWLWHIPGSRIGVADWVGYDDSGFPVASGTVDAGKEGVAVALGELGNTGVSHGMPNEEIRREDPEDETIITRYRTREISPLPIGAAANKMTTFGVVIKSEGGIGHMPLTREQRTWLGNVLSEEQVAELEAFNAGKAQVADALGVESKQTEAAEVGADPPAEPEAPAETEPEGEAEEASTEPEPEGEEAPAEESAEEAKGLTEDAVVEAIGPLIKALAEEVASLKAQVEGMQVTEEKRITEVVQATPAASLASRIVKSVVGQEATLVGEGDPLAGDRPVEMQPKEGSTGIALIDAIRAGKDWREGWPFQQAD